MRVRLLMRVTATADPYEPVLVLGEPGDICEVLEVEIDGYYKLRLPSGHIERVYSDVLYVFHPLEELAMEAE